jgi:hypothetical protein
MLENHSFPHPRLQSGNLNSAQTREITTKRRGELAEMAFHLKATRMGFRVFKPYGDSERYDFILDSGKKLWTVQVQSTTTIPQRPLPRKFLPPHQRQSGEPEVFPQPQPRYCDGQP